MSPVSQAVRSLHSNDWPTNRPDESACPPPGADRSKALCRTFLASTCPPSGPYAGRRTSQGIANPQVLAVSRSQHSPTESTPSMPHLSASLRPYGIERLHGRRPALTVRTKTACPKARNPMSPDLSSAEFHKSSLSGANGQCVEVATGLPGLVAVRDSKNPSAPPNGTPS
ncbi:DUF397 domain-containing protein [Streptosporangium sp. NPDC001559]|uniref:DUF397 domain-containing protein n=1 Tax=Streptosporangium sp. NPDC001559 TaxID=3366187 RepID=UPI0036F09236